VRILCLDVGEKNIGVAVSDPLGITAQGLGVIKRRDLKSDLEQIRSLLDEYQVYEVVLGLPLNMDGTMGAKAQEVMQFKNYLSRRLPVPVVTSDERLTTAAATRTLLKADVSRARRKKVIDKLAAVLILENYLRFKKKGNNN
jgi:putative Holliday junction resolvase